MKCDGNDPNEAEKVLAHLFPSLPPFAPRAPLWHRLLRRPWPLIGVLLLKSRTCPLCDEALSIVRARARKLGISLRIHEISGHPALEQAFGNEVPVVFVDGRKRFFGRVDPVLLAREIDAARRLRSRPGYDAGP